MNQEKRLEFCKICKNQKFKYSIGIICKLTDRPAEFEDTCGDFKIDNDLISRFNRSIDKEHNTAVDSNKRITNYVVDSFFCNVFALIVFFIVALLSSSLSLAFEVSIGEENSLFEYLLYVFSLLIYYIGFESLTGKTIGKYITKTKVVDYNGQKPIYKTILLRTACRLIPFEQLSFLGQEPTGWHDKLSKTRVVAD